MVRTYIAVIRNSAAPAAAKMPPISASPVCGEPLEGLDAVVVVALVVAFVEAVVLTVVAAVVVVATVVVVVISSVK